jgi:hypothetical protein
VTASCWSPKTVICICSGYSLFYVALPVKTSNFPRLKYEVAGD